MRHVATTLFSLLAACHSTPTSTPPVADTNHLASKAPLPCDPGVVFLAVLDGLYHEGVANDDVDVMLTRDATTGVFRYFVYACPLCMPTIDALQLYRGPRPRSPKVDSVDFRPSGSCPTSSR
jgi:hypothetical protein